MLMPSIFGENLFDDDWMDFPFERFDRDFWGKKNPLYGKNAKNMMKTDIREHEAGYELDIDLPGFKKDEITVDLENGYLTISAAKGLDKDEEDKRHRSLRRLLSFMKDCILSGDVVFFQEPLLYEGLPEFFLRAEGVLLQSGFG